MVKVNTVPRPDTRAGVGVSVRHGADVISPCIGRDVGPRLGPRDPGAAPTDDQRELCLVVQLGGGLLTRHVHVGEGPVESVRVFGEDQGPRRRGRPDLSDAVAVI
jgi:hypothetical protein